MEKKMTVKEFVKKYESSAKEELKQKMIETITIVDYVPYEDKLSVCERIVDITYYKNEKLKDGTEIKKMHINSPANYMMFCLNIVDQYTTLEVNYKKSLDEFNALNKNRIFDYVFSYIPEHELKEFRMILDMVESDVIQNEYETHAFIRNQVERFGQLTGKVFSPLMTQVTEMFGNMDKETIETMLNNFKAL